MRIAPLSALLGAVISSVYASEAGGLYPPGLLPLINRANVLLSTGQFNEAARIYSEAIDQSPADYLLYYKRATAYFSLSRHSSALDDFEKVLSLTSNTFDNAHLMKARIHAKDGQFPLAREALRFYLKSKASTTDAGAGAELASEIEEGAKMKAKTEKERQSQLWTACVESATMTLRYASHDIEIRQIRAECALASEDIEGAVGDMTRLTHLLSPSTPLLSRIARISYFLLPPSGTPLHTLKQCLHYDPDSKPCLALHRLFKSLDRGFITLDDLLQKEDWRGVVTLLTGKGKKNEFLRRFDDALEQHTSRDMLLPPASASDAADPPIPLPEPSRVSPSRQTLLRALCRAYIRLNQPVHASPHCTALLAMKGSEEDVDGLVGKAETLLKAEEWQEAVHVLEIAWDRSGRGDRDIHGRLQRAQKLLKQSKQKDYYKVLGVARDADSRTIKKAFRTAAKTAHPDKGGSEAKMASVNEAYEVLSKPELRARYDAGDDPNDPMSQQGGGGYAHPFPGGQHPFAQFFQQGGGFPGHGGGRGFEFHFSH
ncbi:hypothetical protein BD779DRAFT_1622562 [Infundibulicybe gibba]|nr:hypothetical protein BD779DRAFT_1622562 [Infundibulicybe gibba]